MAIKIAGTEVINDDKELVLAKLAEIDTSIADTAVDVFVYDTSKDSDGGAWRKRTQGTSWYNETLNTATRGSRKEFPAVAVIVAESDKVTIYDGDDPSLPMWMVFNGNTYSMCPNASISSIFSLNGTICMAGNLATGAYANSGIRQVMFLADTARKHTVSDNHSGLYKGNIEQRNDGLFDKVGSEQKIVNELVNDVAMTVLPNAPIDAATGLPVPTIAVATNGGVSVIKDDGTVVDITGSAGAVYSKAPLVHFSCSDILFGMDASSSNSRTHFRVAIPSSDRTVTSDSSSPTDKDFGRVETGLPVPLGNNGLIGPLRGPAGTFYSNTTEGQTNAQGLTQSDANEIDRTKAMVAYTTSTYNTGWMNGDIKGAFLSDTDDTDLVGSGELVTNGTFDSDVSGWTNLGRGTMTHTGSALSYARDDSLGGGLGVKPNDTLVSGTRYVVSFEVVSGVAVLFAGGVQSTNFSAGTHTKTFIATSTAMPTWWAQNNLATIVLDNISVKLADADRSVNANGLIVNGTVTRSPVATGADLVAYSGFSASNYLEQPYNSDLDFGTGDFSVMYWVKTADLYYTVVDRNDGEGFGLYTAGSSPNSRLRLIIGSTTIDSADTTRLATDTWTQIVVLRRSSTSVEYYINGTLFDTTAIGSSLSASSPSELPARVGVRSDGAQNLTGSLALLRISATAPTAEQIAKIYEDEKVLFQENAQATLYGSSDAVTALAHDDATNLLHVGTSAGRSVFQGLRRVDNTTTAVGTAISASNGMVVEE